MSKVYIYILVMAVVTYIIRMLPLVLIRREIKNIYIKSFLYYVPYVALAAMTFPAILDSTANTVSAVVGFAVALLLSYMERSLIVVAGGACIAVFIVEMLF